MELTIERLRTKQRKRLIQKGLLIFIMLLSSFGAVYYYAKNKNPEPTNTTNITVPNSHNICIGSTIPTPISDFIKNQDLTDILQQNSNIDYSYKLATHTQLADNLVQTHDGEEIKCSTKIARNITDITEYEKIWSRLYIAVTRIDSPINTLSSNDLKDMLQTQLYEIDDKSYYAIWDTDETHNFIKLLFNTTTSQSYPDIDSVIQATQENDNFIAIIPFEYLKPGLKVISINEQSPLNKDFIESSYPLVDNYWISSENDEIATYLRIQTKKHLGQENYDSEKLHDVIIGGNTSIGANSQQSAGQLHNDVTFPIRGLSDLFRSADIAVLSNETSFAQSCTQTKLSQSLCGDLDSFQMLTTAGIDIVGLTGEHIIDQGREAYSDTLELYQDNDIKVFAGGLDYDQAHTPLRYPLGDLKLAFLGFNFVQPYSYGATNFRSGNSQYTQAIMQADLKKAKDLDADYIFVEMNWGSDLQSTPTQNQLDVAKATFDNGADIITGLNPQYINKFTFENNKLAFYGLGNTLAEPINDNARAGILVRHIFYDKKYLGFEIIPTYINENSQTELAQDERKDTILNNLFELSDINFTNDDQNN